jgi:periplasmic protein TonB
MIAATLDGRIFEPPSLKPAWLRPAVVAIVIALHAAALSIVYLAPKPPEPPREVIVDIEPEAPPQEAPNEPEAVPSPAQQTAKEPDAITPPPEPAPPVVEASPPVSLAPAPPPEPQPLPPPETPPPPPAPVELAPPKPPPPRRVEPQPKPALRPVQPKPETAQRKPPHAPAQKTASLEPARPGASTSPPAPAASAASQSGYISAMSAAIRSRLFYPPAARARGAKGVVSVAFTIGALGALTSFAITRSSGDEDLDAAARTLVQSAHFPPPPGGSVHVATSFNYVPR